MVRASLVYTILVVGFLALVIFSNQPEKRVHRKHGPRRLIVRSTYSSNRNNVTHVAFDPVVADIEWRRENREWEREHFQAQYKAWNNTDSTLDHHNENHAMGEEQQPTPWDADEDYLNDEEHFNISHRLAVLFPLLDTNPKDGFVSLKELQDWHVLQAEKLAKQRTDREFEVRDKNHDGLVTIQEYLHLSDEEFANGTKDHGQGNWWKEHFDLADADGNGGLNRTEFSDFLHPEASQNSKLHEWMRREQISENDHDKDGKLNLDEFDHIFDVLRYYGEDLSHLHQGTDAEARKEKFNELDKNKDGFLTEDELEPIMERLHPGESFYAKQQANYLIEQADANKDGRLSLAEMLEHPYVFYSTAYTPEEYPDEFDHDEFR